MYLICVAIRGIVRSKLHQVIEFVIECKVKLMDPNHSSRMRSVIARWHLNAGLNFHPRPRSRSADKAIFLHHQLTITSAKLTTINFCFCCSGFYRILFSFLPAIFFLFFFFISFLGLARKVMREKKMCQWRWYEDEAFKYAFNHLVGIIQVCERKRERE